jgi:diguanylate cyclase (GGDEF)-like protein/PAS domain S-box-containing protein
MRSQLFLWSALVGLGYFLAAGFTIAFTRYEGGFATLWFATAYLTSILAVAPRRHWPLVCANCAIASAFATGLLGLGWTAAVPVSLINMIEAALAALLIRRRVANTTLDSLNWFGSFVLKVGIIAPATGATLGSLVSYRLIGDDFGTAWLTWFSGHALGGLTFTPLAMLVARGNLQKWIASLRRSRWRETALLFCIFLGTTLFTFAQSRWPLLYLPIGPLALICFRHDRALAALSVAVLGLVGGLLTAVNHGPVALISAELATRLQFFQFYLAAVVMTILPITADLRHRQMLIRALRESDERFRLLLENSTDVLLHLRPDGRILYASPSVEQQSGRRVATLLGCNAVDLVDPEWREYVRRCHAEVLSANGRTVRYEYMAMVEGGGVRWFETVSRAIHHESGSLESVISVVRDIDVRKNEEFNLVLEASRDALTGLCNRRAFERGFDSAYGAVPLMIAMIDIDHFKSINDRFGHAGGDCALQTFAEVTQRIVRKSDLIARMGGEEFAILFKGLSSQECWGICERLRLELSEAVTFYGAQPIQFTVSVGVAEVLSPDVQHSLSRADAALYDAKREGRDRLKLAA